MAGKEQHSMIDHDAIRRLAMECARAALIAAPGASVTLPREVPPEYLERLESMLGRRYTRPELRAFERAFKGAFQNAKSAGKPPEGFEGRWD